MVAPSIYISESLNNNKQKIDTFTNENHYPKIFFIINLSKKYLII